MYSKIEIQGTIQVVTGMHIGGSNQFSAIGAVDSPVVRDAYTNLPMIPGSSLKGKLRTLLAKKYNDGNPASKPDDDHIRLLRLFGSAAKGKVKRGRMIFSDMVLSNMEQLKKLGLQSSTEVKFENTIHRLTAVANPRQIERTVRGAEFEMRMVYDMEDPQDLLEDFETIAEGLRLMEYDYLGGHGSRGYGRVSFSEIDIEVVVGEVEESLLDQCRALLKEV